MILSMTCFIGFYFEIRETLLELLSLLQILLLDLLCWVVVVQGRFLYQLLKQCNNLFYLRRSVFFLFYVNKEEGNEPVHLYTIIKRSC